MSRKIWFPSTAERIALYVDQVNGAPDFWDAVEMQTPPNEVAAQLRGLHMETPLFVSPDEARQILEWAATLPEWETDDALLQYNPHPIMVQEAEDAEESMGFETIVDAYRAFEDLFGREKPSWSIEQLQDWIHDRGLRYEDVTDEILGAAYDEAVSA